MSVSQSCRELKEDHNYHSALLTIPTDPQVSDHTYIKTEDPDPHTGKDLLFILLSVPFAFEYIARPCRLWWLLV